MQFKPPSIVTIMLVFLYIYITGAGKWMGLSTEVGQLQ